MKKYLLGFALLLLAAWVLLQGFFGIPPIDLKLWPVFWLLLLGYLTVGSLSKKHWTSAIFLGALTFVAANSFYDLVDISSGTILLAAALAAAGCHFLFPAKYRMIASDERDVSFASSTRYIKTDNFKRDWAEVSFGTYNIYFDNAFMLEEEARFDVDISFASMVLYIPASWQVELRVENSFGSISQSQHFGETDKKLIVAGDLSFGSLRIIYI